MHRAYFEMGKILLEQGKYRRAISVSEKAIKAYEEYLEAHPEDHSAWWELGYIYEVRSDYSKEWDKAQEALEKAVELSPSNSFTSSTWVGFTIKKETVRKLRKL